MVAELFGIVAPVFACAGFGWLWTRVGREYPTEFMTALLSDVGAPCLVFSSLIALEVQPAAMVGMAGAALLSLALFAVVGSAALRLAGLPQTGFLAPMIFANAGNLALPLCLFAFGREGLAYGVCYYAVAALMHFTVGIWIWSGEVSARALLRTPLAYAALFAAAIVATGVEVPTWLRRTADLLGGFTIPLMLVTLGVSLSRIHAVRLGRTVLLAALRIGMGAAVGFGLAWAFGFEGAARGALVIACSGPPAVFNYLMASRYGRAADDIASLVVVGTLASMVTYPIVIALAL